MKMMPFSSFLTKAKWINNTNNDDDKQEHGKIDLFCSGYDQEKTNK